MRAGAPTLAAIFALFAVIFSGTAVASSPANPNKLASAKVESKVYAYGSGDETFEGLISRPKGAPIKGGVLIVHNWMGVSDETKKQAERFAEQGFLVISADVYGKGVRPSGPEQAGKLATQYKSNRALLRSRIALALAELTKQPEVKGKAVIAAGYCFGGTGVIELARSGADVAGVLSFHGGLDSPTPADGAKIRGRVVAFHGADDPFVSAADLGSFEKEMMDNKVDWELVKLGGAVHSFTDVGAGTDPAKGAAYNANADKRSWDMTKLVLSDLITRR
jgi:dienelactone hydrolase